MKPSDRTVHQAVAAVAKRFAAPGAGVTGRAHDEIVRAVAKPLADAGVLVVPASTVLAETVVDGFRWVRLTVTWRVYGPQGDSVELQNVGEWVSAAKAPDLIVKSALSMAEADVLCRLLKLPTGEALVDSHDHVPRNVERVRSLRRSAPPIRMISRDDAVQRIAGVCGGDDSIVAEVLGGRSEVAPRTLDAMVERARKLYDTSTPPAAGPVETEAVG